MHRKQEEKRRTGKEETRKRVREQERERLHTGKEKL
jgi:hypothetical protein